MKDLNAESEDSGSKDEENEKSSPENSGESGTSLPEEEFSNTETGFEEQEGEVLPPADEKKSGSGKVFFFLILILVGLGGYLYTNNLIPTEIQNLISPASPTTSALVAQTPPTPLPEESSDIEIADNPDFKIITESPDSIQAPPSTPVTHQEAPHICGNSNELIPETRISGNSFGHIYDEEPADEPDEILREETDIEQEMIKEPEVNQKPFLEATAPPIKETASLGASESPERTTERNEATQAYLDFIEFSVQKTGEWIREGLSIGWEYLQNKLG
jgi:hypothetical protein